MGRRSRERQLPSPDRWCPTVSKTREGSPAASPGVERANSGRPCPSNFSCRPFHWTSGASQPAESILSAQHSKAGTSPYAWSEPHHQLRDAKSRRPKELHRSGWRKPSQHPRISVKVSIQEHLQSSSFFFLLQSRKQHHQVRPGSP